MCALRTFIMMTMMSLLLLNIHAHHLVGLSHLFISFLASHMFKRRIVNIVAALGEESQEAVAFQLSSGSLSLLIEFAHCDVVVVIRTTYTLTEK